LISYGPILEDILSNIKDKEITIINAVFQKPLNMDYLRNLLSYENIIIYDPYSIEEGFAYHLEITLRRLGFNGNIQTYALKNEFITCGSIEQQLSRYNLDLDSILKEINKLL
jgi:deoxyxylulose-5-phosphate synthase